MGDASSRRHYSRTALREILLFALVYFFLALIQLGVKLKLTPGWSDGSLESMHARLMAREYTNNEQSRLLQFLVPELFVRSLGLSVPHAYLVQRWLFVWLAFVLFHLYLRHWFSAGITFGGVCFLAAVVPLTYGPDLQESAPLLMVTFLLGLWAVRAERPVLFALALLVGAADNETSLFLAAVFALAAWPGKPFVSVAWRTALVSAPAFVFTAIVRYVNRDRPHLLGAWHLPDNLAGLWDAVRASPLEYPRIDYLGPLVLFGPMWVLAFVGWAGKPRFLRGALAAVPLFIVPHLITGVIGESRQMVPMAYILIPGAFFTLFAEPRPSGSGTAAAP
jgi:hypothetical protein